MFYHPNDSKVTIIIKHAAFWGSLLTMFVLFVFLFRDDVKIPQKEITLKIDVRNKVNICSPEDEKLFQKSFFDF